MCNARVIEDDPLIASCVADVAMMGGATSFVIASSEDEAMAAAITMLPGIILSDVDLKGGGTGTTACAAIRARFGEIPVIFITGDPEGCEASDLAAAIIRKPVTASILLAAFREFANSS